MSYITRKLNKLRQKETYVHFLNTLKYSLYVIFHPADGFWDLIHAKRGSYAAANFIVIVTLLTHIWKLQFTNFIILNVNWNRVGVGIENAGDTQTDIEKACCDLARADNELKFLVDVPAGAYKVDVYAGAAYSNNAYNNCKVLVNGEDLGTVSQSAKVADIVKSQTVVFEEDSQIEVVSSNEGSLAILNAVVITNLTPVYGDAPAVN